MCSYRVIILLRGGGGGGYREGVVSRFVGGWRWGLRGIIRRNWTVSYFDLYVGARGQNLHDFIG